MKTLTLNEVAERRFDIAFAICGYETRATYLARIAPVQAKNHVVLDYACDGQLSYDANRAFYTASPDNHLVPIDDELEASLAVTLAEAVARLEDDAKLSVFIDISSCSRSIIAKLLLAIEDSANERAEITCAYALSAFENPPDSELPSHISQPVVGDLSGWSDDLSKPPCAVIGMGFEPGRALGCMDYLEIPEVRLFMPLGIDDRFEAAVKAANAVLIAETGTRAVLPYSVLDPAATYEKLESLIFGLLKQFRPVIIPLGPKIFAALAIVLAIRILPRICVWRTSSGTIGEIVDRTASGEVSIFTTEL